MGNNIFLDRLAEHKLVAIIRGVPKEKVKNAALAVFEGGIRNIEITFDQSDPEGITETAAAIRMVKKELGTQMQVGAGTVMSTAQVTAAADAGADFILSPNTNAQVIRTAKARKLFCVPGALTPGEIAAAYELGADVVKLFPAGTLGANYVKAIAGPLNHIPLMGVGAVSLDNISDLYKAGIMSFGLGTNIIDGELVQREAWQSITALAGKYISILNKDIEKE